jgi:hypothetical protein
MLRAPAGSRKRITDFFTIGKILFEQECPLEFRYQAGPWRCPASVTLFSDSITVTDI